MEFHYPTQEELTELFTVQLKEARNILKGSTKAPQLGEQQRFLQVVEAQKVYRKALNVFKLIQGRMELWDEVELYNYLIRDGQTTNALFIRVAECLGKLPYYLIFELDREPKPKPAIDISARLQQRGK